MSQRRTNANESTTRTSPLAASQLQSSDGAVRDRMLLIVVGARLESEIAERPLAIELRDAVERWLTTEIMQGCLDVPAHELLHPVICTDVWYLNDASLSSRPVLCLGPPEHNAATAWYSTKLPSAFVHEGCYRIQLDPEWLDLTACIWGIRTSDTAAALRTFCERYLDDFLRASMEA